MKGFPILLVLFGVALEVSALAWPRPRPLALPEVVKIVKIVKVPAGGTPPRKGHHHEGQPQYGEQYGTVHTYQPEGDETSTGGEHHGDGHEGDGHEGDEHQGDEHQGDGDSTPNGESTPSGSTETSSTCSGSSSSLQVSWSGDVVPLSLNGMKTEGCTDLSGAKDGRVVVNPINGDGTLLEWTPGQNPPNVDVSFVQAFTVSVVCTLPGGKGAGTKDQTGCVMRNQKEGVFLKNPRGPGGTEDNKVFQGPGHEGDKPWCYACSPPDDDFRECAGQAYTFPYDDSAMGMVSNSIACCVGKGCKFTPKANPNNSGTDGAPRDDCRVCGSMAKRELTGDEWMGGAGNETMVQKEEEERARVGLRGRRKG